MVEIAGFGKSLPDKKTKEIKDRDYIYTFDSGEGVTLEDTFAHVLGTGITGAGKTASVGAPMLKGALKTGCAAFIADHKGNLRKIARKICKMVGREQDIIEFGSGPLATPVNILEGLPIYQARQFFSILMRKVYNDKTNNADFHEKGVQYCVDALILCRLLKEVLPNFPSANLALVCEMMMSEKNSMALYDYFKKNVYDPNNEEHYEFARRVESTPFHILSKGEHNVGDRERNLQMAYNMNLVKLAMCRFLEVSVLKKNFSSGGQGLNFKEVLEQKKIVLFRLDPGIGPVGEDICRMLIEAMYQAIIERGVENAQPVFIFLDEFQSICDLSDAQFSDRRFISECREFKGTVVALTQNVAGLGYGANVDNLIHNFNTKIMLYNSDPATQELLKTYPDADLTSLERGEAYVIRYDSTTGQHIPGVEKCNNAYQEMKDALAQINDEDLLAEMPKMEEPMSLVAIVKELSESGAGRVVLPKKEPVPPPMPKKPDRKLRMVEGLMKVEGWHKKKIYESDDFRFKYPNLFAINAEVNCPKGWVAYLDKALQAFLKSGLTIQIRKFDMNNASPQIDCDDSSSQVAKNVMYQLTQKLSEFCPYCGKPVKHEYHSRAIMICESCIEKFGLDNNDFPMDKPVDIKPLLKDDECMDKGAFF